MKRIYLLGSERSGSNLLRTLLGNHSQISAPIAPHLCDVFYKRIGIYHPYTDQNLKALYTDIEAYVNHAFNDWNIQFDHEGMIQKYRSDSFIGVFDSVFSEKAAREEKSGYFSKDNHLHKYALGIFAKFSDAKFIYLYRDPRDQVASWMRTPIHLHTPHKAMTKWVNEQRECLILNDFYGLPVCFVKYEDLVDNPEAVMTQVLNFVRVEVQEQCFQTKRDNKEAEKHPLWSNINKPVKQKNYGKYGDVLSEKDLKMIESMAGNLMSRLGYKRETVGKWKKENRFIFSLKERIRERKSIIRNKDFLDKEMGILKDKNRTVKEIFERRTKQ